MSAENIYEKLEKYEQKAYKGGRGDDWLIEMGEQVKIYFLKCAQSNSRPSIKGLEKNIDQLAKWFFDDGEKP